MSCSELPHSEIRLLITHFHTMPTIEQLNGAIKSSSPRVSGSERHLADVFSVQQVGTELRPKISDVILVEYLDGNTRNDACLTFTDATGSVFCAYRGAVFLSFIGAILAARDFQVAVEVTPLRRKRITLLLNSNRISILVDGPYNVIGSSLNSQSMDGYRSSRGVTLTLTQGDTDTADEESFVEELPLVLNRCGASRLYTGSEG